MRIYDLKINPTKPDWFYKPPTEKQLECLRRFRTEIPEGLNRGQASGLLHSLFQNPPPGLWEDGYEEVAMKILKEGSPFDDPAPAITFPGKQFVFTGTFTAGTRKECHQLTENLGGDVSRGITLSTDYLVVGNKNSSHWVQSSYGRKIEKAAFARMKTGKPAIVCESDWVAAVMELAPQDD